MKIYTLTIINENMDIVSTSAYVNREDAKKALAEDYAKTKKMLEFEGWGEEDLESDVFESGHYYWLGYGDSDYYAQINETTLYE